jgi:hypothetical protein
METARIVDPTGTEEPGFTDLAQIDAERAGEYLHTSVGIWWCGDNECDCRQVTATRMYRHKLVPSALYRFDIWRGTFFSNGEGNGHLGKEIHVAVDEVKARYPDERIQSINGISNLRGRAG